MSHDELAVRHADDFSVRMARGEVESFDEGPVFGLVIGGVADVLLVLLQYMIPLIADHDPDGRGARIPPGTAIRVDVHEPEWRQSRFSLKDCETVPSP